MSGNRGIPSTVAACRSNDQVLAISFMKLRLPWYLRLGWVCFTGDTVVDALVLGDSGAWKDGLALGQGPSTPPTESLAK